MTKTPWPILPRADLPEWQRRLVDAFIAKVWVPDMVEYPDACYIWQACLNSTGYGQFYWPDPDLPKPRGGGRSTSANRASYILFVEDLLPEERACHKCDERLCVRPSHLFRGTAADNMQDMIAKGRGRWQQRRAA